MLHKYCRKSEGKNEKSEKSEKPDKKKAKDKDSKKSKCIYEWSNCVMRDFIGQKLTNK